MIFGRRRREHIDPSEVEQFAERSKELQATTDSRWPEVLAIHGYSTRRIEQNHIGRDITAALTRPRRTA